MRTNDHSMRLDQILINDGLVNDDQVKEALQHQKKHGGKLGSLLMKFGHVDEAGLVAALARQYNCDSVVLSDLEINELVIKFIPKRIAVARRVMPFDYNPDENILMVAAADPTDSYLNDELNFVARGKKVKLYVAVEHALKNAIELYYDVELNLTSETELPAETSENDKPQDQDEPTAISHDSEPMPASVLLLGLNDSEQLVIESLVGLGGKKVELAGSAEEYALRLDDQAFELAIIKQPDEESLVRLKRQLISHSPAIKIHTFENILDLLNGRSASSSNVELLVENLDLFVMMLASRDNLKVNHSALVGRYTNLVCQRLALDDQNRAVITTAAYLHDLARYYYDAAGVPDYPRTVCDLTTKLLKSLNYSEAVIEVLNRVYRPLESGPEQLGSIAVLGGNIITAAATLCEIIPATDKIPTDKFAQARNCLDEMVGKEITQEVSEALLAIVQESMLSENKDDRFSHILVLGRETKTVALVMTRLKEEGYHPASENNLEAFAGLFKRSTPDMMLIVDSAEFDQVDQLVEQMGQLGVNLSSIPTFVLTDPDTGINLSKLLDFGIEDIVPPGDNHDLLVAKMNRIRSRAIADSQQIRFPGQGQPDADTHGHLRDMNLIDLLQTLGPNRKTVRLLVQSPEGSLTMYLREGNIIHASYDKLSGVEAVYKGLSWSDGTWAIYSLRQNDLPAQNVYCTYQNILLEGCRQLDESGHLEIGSV